MGEKNRGAGSKDLMVLSGTEREKGEREETNDEREDTKTVKMKRGMKFYREKKKEGGRQFQAESKSPCGATTHRASLSVSLYEL